MFLDFGAVGEQFLERHKNGKATVRIMGKFLQISAIAMLLAIGCSSIKTSKRLNGLPLCYHNRQFNLTFYLPASWRGYSMVSQEWTGYPGTERGPIIVLRNPRWKTNDLYQDIPIMVFTRKQWDEEEHGKFFPYAGGVISEMWHNDQYVFGNYSRYNAYDEVKGWKEAEDIIEQNCDGNKMQPLYPTP
ncbi:MAG TPA: hypothetical protein VGY56_13280 [Verrucomicrobiae bacterium]|nr:hypothetical protein [Verrucomicrobiae bacterium]